MLLSFSLVVLVALEEPTAIPAEESLRCPVAPKEQSATAAAVLCLWTVYWITFKKNEGFSLIKTLDWDQN